GRDSSNGFYCPVQRTFMCVFVCVSCRSQLPMLCRMFAVRRTSPAPSADTTTCPLADQIFSAQYSPYNNSYPLVSLHASVSIRTLTPNAGLQNRLSWARSGEQVKTTRRR